MNSIGTKTTIGVTEVKKNYKKNFGRHKLMLQHNKELKAKIYVATMKV